MNKFGGFRIRNAKWDIDIWTMKNTWVFAQGHVDYRNINSLLDTTLMSWDSVLYSFPTNKIGAYVRLLRPIYGKNVVNLGEKATKSLYNFFLEVPTENIVDYEYKSYTTYYINNQKLARLKEALDTNSGNGDFRVTSVTQLAFDI